MYLQSLNYKHKIHSRISLSWTHNSKKNFQHSELNFELTL
jgi:hypothetical protein